MIKRLSAFLAAAVLAACAAPLPPPAEPIPHGYAEGRAWIYNAEGGEPRLAYGTPQSDDVLVMMSCRPRSGVVDVAQGGLRPGEAIALSSGPHTLTLRGRAEPDQLNGGVFMTARTSLQHPVMQGFRRAGALAILQSGQRVSLQGTAADQRQVTSFFEACGA